jgi:hypothetical protein
MKKAFAGMAFASALALGLGVAMPNTVNAG